MRELIMKMFLLAIMRFMFNKTMLATVASFLLLHYCLFCSLESNIVFILFQ